jgi:HlyD family secretion protein
LFSIISIENLNKILSKLRKKIISRKRSNNMEKNISNTISHIIKLGALLFSTLLIFGCEPSDSTITGYIEGEYTYVSTSATGILQQLAVLRGQQVKEGDLLYQIDPEPEASSLKAAQASISNLTSQVAFYRLQLSRQQNMFQKNATSKMDLEQAQAAYESYVQQLAASQAQLLQNQWALDQKTVKAPISGTVFDTFYVLGEKVLTAKPVLAILNPSNIQVIFYIPESQLGSLKIGQKIGFSCDACSDNNQATISYISSEAKYTPPIIYNKDNRNQLVYMVRAHMPAQIAKQFHPGQPVDINLL